MNKYIGKVLLSLAFGTAVTINSGWYAGCRGVVTEEAGFVKECHESECTYAERKYRVDMTCKDQNGKEYYPSAVYAESELTPRYGDKK